MMKEWFLSSDGIPQDPPVDKDKINSLVAELKDAREIRKYRQMLAQGFVITFPSGDVKLTAK